MLASRTRVEIDRGRINGVIAIAVIGHHAERHRGIELRQSTVVHRHRRRVRYRDGNGGHGLVGVAVSDTVHEGVITHKARVGRVDQRVVTGITRRAMIVEAHDPVRPIRQGGQREYIGRWMGVIGRDINGHRDIVRSGGPIAPGQWNGVCSGRRHVNHHNGRIAAAHAIENGIGQGIETRKPGRGRIVDRIIFRVCWRAIFVDGCGAALAAHRIHNGQCDLIRIRVIGIVQYVEGDRCILRRGAGIAHCRRRQIARRRIAHHHRDGGHGLLVRVI